MLGRSTTLSKIQSWVDVANPTLLAGLGLPTARYAIAKPQSNLQCFCPLRMNELACIIEVLNYSDKKSCCKHSSAVKGDSTGKVSSGKPVSKAAC
jgi:hypothetical protein